MVTCEIKHLQKCFRAAGAKSSKNVKWRRLIWATLYTLQFIKRLTGRAKKSNPLGKIWYLWNCSRFFHQVYSVYR